MKKISKILFVLFVAFIFITLISAIPYIILEIVAWIQFIATQSNNDILLSIRNLCFDVGLFSFIITVLLGIICYILDKKI